MQDRLNPHGPLWNEGHSARVPSVPIVSRCPHARTAYDPDPPVTEITYGSPHTFTRSSNPFGAEGSRGVTTPTALAARPRGRAASAVGALAIDYNRRRVTVDGRAVALTATEYEILRILSVHAGSVVTSESLLRQAWDDRQPTDTERVRAFVKQIRAKLGDDAARPTWVFNERGVGYRMAKPGDE